MGSALAGTRCRRGERPDSLTRRTRQRFGDSVGEFYRLGAPEDRDRKRDAGHGETLKYSAGRSPALRLAKVTHPFEADALRICDGAPQGADAAPLAPLPLASAPMAGVLYGVLGSAC
jgi:hypothetical protein